MPPIAGGFAPGDTGSRPLRILLIEDSRADADLLLDILADELPDAIVELTTTLAEAVPLLAQPLDIAITDLSLPDAQGLETLSAILVARPDIAVVMTGRQDRDLAPRALSEAPRTTWSRACRMPAGSRPPCCSQPSGVARSTGPTATSGSR